METAKVVKGFFCKTTNQHYHIGYIYRGTPERIAELAAKGIVQSAPKAHIPKAEVAEPHKFALLSHDPATAQIAPTPKRKRNEHK